MTNRSANPISIKDVENRLLARGASVHTSSTYTRVLAKVMIWAGTDDVRDLADLDFAPYFNALREGRTPDASITLAASSLNRVFKDFLGQVPIGIPQTKYVGTDVGQVLVADQVRSLMGSCTSPRDAALISLLFWSGLKLSEVRLLTPLDLSGRPRKIGGSFRTHGLEAPTTDEELDQIERYVVEFGPTVWLFYGSSRPCQLSQRRVQEIVRQAGERHGLAEPLTADSLRDSFAVLQLKSGIPPFRVAQMMGFKSVRSIEPHVMFVERLLGITRARRVPGRNHGA